jgi:hypothetical protein
MNTLDRNRIVWEQWFQLQDKCKQEGIFRGMDCGGHGLCSHPKNTGTVEQEGHTKRCGLPFCHFKSQVDAKVNIHMGNITAANDEKMIPVIVDTPRVTGKVIDLTPFVSKDAVDYEANHV